MSDIPSDWDGVLGTYEGVTVGYRYWDTDGEVTAMIPDGEFAFPTDELRQMASDIEDLTTCPHCGEVISEGEDA